MMSKNLRGLAPQAPPPKSAYGYGPSAVAYRGFEKGGGPIHAFPLPSPPSPLAHTPPSPPSPLYFPALPSQPLLPPLPLLTGIRGYNPGKFFKLQMRVDNI
jgi:hypothetical protein